jgi:HlyD family type I secretion membrane fusion protein
MYEKLIDKGVISKKDYLELLRVITQVEEEINKAKAAHLETQYSISKLEQRLNNIEVKSPIHGLVKGLQAHISNIIAPGGYLMEIVPLENLIVESRLKASDVGLVRIGDKVRVKVDTYDYTRFGEIEGTLMKLSATTFLENPSNPTSLAGSGAPGTPTNTQGTVAFYKATIQLAKVYVGSNPEKNKLLPGMTVIADIHVGTKSLLKYLLKPVHAVIETSFREQ